MRTSAARRLLAGCLLLIMMLPATAFARVAYACRMSGLVHATCCCRAKQARAFSVPAQDACERPLAKRPTCCTVEIDPGKSLPATLSDAPAGKLLFAAPAAVELDLERRVIDEDPAPLFRRSRAPPPPRLPLYIRHRALLN